MICDLALADSPVVLHADIALIGGGTVGLVIADRLARKGLRTVVLESGSRQQTANANALNEVECTEQDYGGAQEGRARGLGGTSQIWGGALIPFLPLEFDARPELGRIHPARAAADLLRCAAVDFDEVAEAFDAEL